MSHIGCFTLRSALLKKQNVRLMLNVIYMNNKKLIQLSTINYSTILTHSGLGRENGFVSHDLLTEHLCETFSIVWAEDVLFLTKHPSSRLSSCKVSTTKRVVCKRKTHLYEMLNTLRGDII